MITKHKKKEVANEAVRKNGLKRHIGDFVEALNDESSKLHKTVKGFKKGVSIAQDIAKGYNGIAQWVGMPQVPKPLLGGK